MKIFIQFKMFILICILETGTSIEFGSLESMKFGWRRKRRKLIIIENCYFQEEREKRNILSKMGNNIIFVSDFVGWFRRPTSSKEYRQPRHVHTIRHYGVRFKKLQWLCQTWRIYQSILLRSIDRECCLAR